jgi:hypothetical protein
MLPDRRVILIGFISTLLVVPAITRASASKFLYKDSLKLKASDKPHLVMELEMPSKLYEKIITSRGQDLDLENTTLKFRGDTVSINDAHL